MADQQSLSGKDADALLLRASVPPWLRKKRFLIPAGLAVLLLVGLVSQGMQSPQTPAVVAPTTQSPTAPATAATPDQAQSVAAAKAQAEADAKAKSDAQARAKAAAAAALKNPASYPTISVRDYALIAKDPDAHTGQKAVVYGYVSQFDAATGSDTFRSDTGGARMSDWSSYDVNTVVSATDSSILEDVVEGDLVTMYVQVMGSFSYDTQIGGSTTALQLQVNLIKVTGSTK